MQTYKEGYGKSLIFHLTPLLMFARDHIKQVEFLSPWKSVGISTQDVSSIVIGVVSSLNSLIQDQISRLKSSRLSQFHASAISINIRKEIFHGEITIGLHILGFGFK
jgi:hypothetical protein